MTKAQIEAVHQALIDGDWGKIEPEWFEYIDISGLYIGYDDDHVAFQQILQSVPS